MFQSKSPTRGVRVGLFDLSNYVSRSRKIWGQSAKCHMAALSCPIPVIANLRVPPMESEVGVRVQYGQHSSPRARNARCPWPSISDSLKFWDLEAIHMSYDMKECGKRIQQLRIQCNYSQQQLAKNWISTEVIWAILNRGNEVFHWICLFNFPRFFMCP